ncbi:MAG: hypothetical protein ABW250_26875 [Pyrinomonadaceae bacterium]
MTARELVDILQGFDPDARVVIHGHAGGYDDVAGVDEIPLRLNVNSEGGRGAHEYPEEGETADGVALLIA